MITSSFARLIAREHRKQQITGKVLTLGRQTVGLSYQGAVDLLRNEGLTASPLAKITSIDNKEDKTRAGRGKAFITDRVFFGMLGLKDVKSLDLEPYEAADIIHNLNYPVPEDLREGFDFILDGGTFDHLVDIRVALENVVRMLKPGGRILQYNAASNFTGASYLSFSPDFFYDYYVVNRFADCRVYVAEANNIFEVGPWYFYEYLGTSAHYYFPSDRAQLTVVWAQKGENSSWDQIPVQAQYRDDKLWPVYREVQAKIAERRKSLERGTSNDRAEVRFAEEDVLESGVLERLQKRGAGWAYEKVVERFSRALKSVNWARKDRWIKGYKYVGRI